MYDSTLARETMHKFKELVHCRKDVERQMTSLQARLEEIDHNIINFSPPNKKKVKVVPVTASIPEWDDDDFFSQPATLTPQQRGGQKAAANRKANKLAKQKAARKAAKLATVNTSEAPPVFEAPPVVEAPPVNGTKMKFKEQILDVLPGNAELSIDIAAIIQRLVKSHGFDANDKPQVKYLYGALLALFRNNLIERHKSPTGAYVYRLAAVPRITEKAFKKVSKNGKLHGMQTA